MTEPAKARIALPDGPIEVELGPDVDLDAEVVLDRNGRRYDDDYVAEIVEGAHEYVVRRGRPSLSGRAGAASPVLHTRVSPELRGRVTRRAKIEGKTESELVREALEAFLT